MKYAKKHQKHTFKPFRSFRSSDNFPKKCGSALSFGSADVLEVWKRGSGRRWSACVVVFCRLSVFAVHQKNIKPCSAL